MPSGWRRTGQYSNLKLSPPQFKGGDGLTVEVDVQNTSTIDGDEVAELYLEFPPVAGAPARACRGSSGCILRRDTSWHLVNTTSSLEEVSRVRPRQASAREYR